ncbi:hypothetical protein BACCOPRO_00513 [Phocaeicola coprophilus DSM 18228 = JCM 13818]|uniref:Uncharacterized protein n=1 Tax=Phocaeicola coprophilus DSM 18228 = JCM 13818 TaxID=547042 RepID=S0F910_9BACT|nr:hypothetical protein BACCOPRO_00513 [Phocaeicola coprophilus DSM 18228 = JCM 13818]
MGKPFALCCNPIILIDSRVIKLEGKETKDDEDYLKIPIFER